MVKLFIPKDLNIPHVIIIIPYFYNLFVIIRFDLVDLSEICWPQLD